MRKMALGQSRSMSRQMSSMTGIVRSARKMPATPRLSFSLVDVREVAEARDVTLLATGSEVMLAMQAADKLAAEGKAMKKGAPALSETKHG